MVTIGMILVPPCYNIYLLLLAFRYIAST